MSTDTDYCAHCGGLHDGVSAYDCEHGAPPLTPAQVIYGGLAETPDTFTHSADADGYRAYETAYDTHGGDYQVSAGYNGVGVTIGVRPSVLAGMWSLSGHVCASGYCLPERLYTRRASAIRAIPGYVRRALADLERTHGERALYATCFREHCSQLAPDGMYCGEHGGRYTPREQSQRAFLAQERAAHARLTARSLMRRLADLEAQHKKCHGLPRGCADNPACAHHAAVCDFYGVRPSGAAL